MVEIEKLSMMKMVGCLVLGIMVGLVIFSCVDRESMAMLDYRMGENVEGSMDENNMVKGTSSYETNPGVGNPCVGEIGLFYAKNKFDPKCCAHSNISNSRGCACLTMEQLNCMAGRGGNNSGGGSV